MDELDLEAVGDELAKGMAGLVKEIAGEGAAEKKEGPVWPLREACGKAGPPFSWLARGSGSDSPTRCVLQQWSYTNQGPTLANVLRSFVAEEGEAEGSVLLKPGVKAHYLKDGALAGVPVT